MMKLKTNKTLTKKKPRKKIRNKRTRIKLKKIIYEKLSLND